MTKNTNANTEEVINRLVDLYFIQTQKYLIQTKTANYITVDTKRKSDKQKKVLPVCDWQIINHLKFKHTLGAYGGVFKNKFLCFDVDFHDQAMAKWITYKIANSLNEFGIREYHISYSGNKGYHIELFFEDLILLDNAKKLFELVTIRANILQYTNEANKVEFRVTDRQGVKIPLGIHQKTKKFCGFCIIDDGLRVMSEEESYSYLLQIEKIKEQRILDVLGLHKVEQLDENKAIQIEEALAHYSELHIYSPREDDAINRAIELINNGLKYQGSRHNSLLTIAKYFLYCGMEEEVCKDTLYDWMAAQDTKTYTSNLNDCFRDIDLIVKYTYERNYNIKPRQKFVEVTYQEMLYILDHSKETSQILLSYAFLVHGRFFAKQDGVFYFPFSTMAKATGLSEKTCRNQVDFIEKIGVFKIISRNEKQQKSCLKKANKYRLTLDIHDEPSITYNVSLDTTVTEALKSLFNDEELKNKIGRKRYKKLIG